MAGLDLALRILLSPVIAQLFVRAAAWPLAAAVTIIRRLDILSWERPRRRGQDTQVDSIMLYELIAVVSRPKDALRNAETNNQIGPSGLNRRGQGVRFQSAFRTCDHNHHASLHIILTQSTGLPAQLAPSSSKTAAPSAASRTGAPSLFQSAPASTKPSTTRASTSSCDTTPIPLSRTRSVRRYRWIRV